MEKGQKFISTLLTLVFVSSVLVFTLPSVKAFGISNSNKSLTVHSGERVEHTIRLTGLDIAMTPQYLLQFVDYEVTSEGAKTFLPLDKYSPYGISKWIDGDREVNIEASETSRNYNLTIAVPENTSPGTYKLAILLSPNTASTNSEGGSSFGINARVASFLYYTVVDGEVNEDFTLNTFSSNESDNGNSFSFEVKNTGNIAISPVGKIFIYKKNGEQVKKITEKTENEKTTYLDYIIVNGNRSIVFAGEKRTFNIKPAKLKLDAGNYVAELKLHNATTLDEENFKELSSKTEFSIKDDFTINSFNAPFIVFGTDTPFNIKVKNLKDYELSIEGKLNIYSMFGKKVAEINIDKFSVQPSKDYDIKNLKWVSSSSFGYYIATLQLNKVGANFVVDKSTNVLIGTWWQITLAIFVFFLIIFAIYKGVSMYAKLKKKIETLEHDEKS